jgi:lipoyl(octanoyl) transferase
MSGSTLPTDRKAIVSLDLGRVDYEQAWTLQREIQKLIIDAKLSTPQVAVPNVLLTLEHPPVYTIGKSGDVNNLLVDEAGLAGRGATFVKTDRGGDITFHGPGQLVGYPIFDLDRFFTDIDRYLRTLESAIISTCSSYGIEAGRVAGRTGVWIDPGSTTERKVCAMGIRCSRWVTMHGFALNMNTELAFYENIVPCGISDRSVTSLAAELGRPIDPEDCRERVLQSLTDAFDAEITSTDSLEDLFDKLNHVEA